jgi:hypothetical protein
MDDDLDAVRQGRVIADSLVSRLLIFQSKYHFH